MLKSRIRNLSNMPTGNKIEQSSPDTVYFNVDIPYNDVDPANAPAVYQSQLSQPILFNPQDYYCSVVRFQVSGTNIPILIARIQPYPNQDANQTIYSVGMGYNGGFSPETFVRYVQYDFTYPIPTPPMVAGATVDYTPYYYIYQYQTFLNMINTALAAALSGLPSWPAGLSTVTITASLAANTPIPNPTSILTVTVGTGILPGMAIQGAGVTAGVVILKQLTGTIGGTGTYLVSTQQTVGSVSMNLAESPYFIFDPTTQKISLIAQQAFYDLGGNGPFLPITIYMNYYAFRFFDGLQIYEFGKNATGRNVQLDVRNQNNSNWYLPSNAAPATGPTDYTLLQMEQEFVTLADWNSLKSVQLVSNLLPINREYIPTNSSSNTNSGVISSIGVLADFIPFVNIGNEFKTTIDFVANGPWRLIDMFGDAAISRIDLYFFWTDELNVQRIIQLPYGENASAKLLFIKKAIAGQLLEKMG